MQGGAIYADNVANVSINKCNFTNNQAQIGGAIYGENTNRINVSNSKFKDNKAEKSGGAIYLSGFNGIVSSCNFNNNTAIKYGGAIYWYGENGTVDTCNFTNNKAEETGGAIYLEIDNATISNSIFKNNKAKNYRNIYHTATLVLSNSTLETIVTISQISDRHAGSNAIVNLTFDDGTNIEEYNVTLLNNNKIIKTFTYNSTYNYTHTLEDLAAGDYSITVGNVNANKNKYTASYEPINFTVTKYESSVNINPINNVTYNTEVVVDFHVENRTNITVIVTNVQTGKKITFNNYTGSEFRINDLAAGEYNITIINSENKYYISSNASALFNIAKATSKVEIKTIINGTYKTTNATINYNIINQTTAHITIKDETGKTIYDEDYNLKPFTIGKLAAGKYNITITNKENDNFTASNASAIFNIAKATSKVEIETIINGTYKTTNATIKYNIINQTTAHITIKDETGKTIYDKDHNANSFTIANLAAGKYNITITNKGNNNYTASNASAIFNIAKATTKVNIGIIINGTYQITNATINYNIFNSTTVHITIKDETGKIVYDKDYAGSPFSIGNLTVGTYTITIINKENDNFTSSNASALFSVKNAPGKRNFADIQALIDNAESGDTITINGLYLGFGDEIIITKDNLTIIGNNDATLDAQGLSRIIFINATGVTLKNIKFKNAKTTGNGSAIYWTGANGTVENCNFENNTATSGGAIYWTGENGTVTNCDFTNNKADEYGGAISWNSNNGVVSNCNFNNNTATQYGGAIDWYNSDNGKIENCNFTNNKANEGGAIDWYNSTQGTINNCNFNNNTANTGGAIDWYNSANGTVSNCKFTNNSAENGGGIYWTGDNGTITNCDFIKTNGTAIIGNGDNFDINDINIKDVDGNAINITGKNPTVSNVDISDVTGDAIIIDGLYTSVTVKNATVSDVDGIAMNVTGKSVEIKNSTIINAGKGIIVEATNGSAVIDDVVINNIKSGPGIDITGETVTVKDADISNIKDGNAITAEATENDINIINTNINDINGTAVNANAPNGKITVNNTNINNTTNKAIDITGKEIEIKDTTINNANTGITAEATEGNAIIDNTKINNINDKPIDITGKNITIKNTEVTNAEKGIEITAENNAIIDNTTINTIKNGPGINITGKNITIKDTDISNIKDGNAITAEATENDINIINTNINDINGTAVNANAPNGKITVDNTNINNTTNKAIDATGKNVTIKNTEVTNTGKGIEITAEDTAIIDNTKIDSIKEGSGINVTGKNVTVKDTQVSNVKDGINVDAPNGEVHLVDNIISNTNGTAVDINAPNGDVSVKGTTITNATGDSIKINSTNASVETTVIEKSNVNDPVVIANGTKNVEPTMDPDKAFNIPTTQTKTPVFSIDLNNTNATGELVVEIDGKIVGRANLVNGKADVIASGLSEGEHNVIISYVKDGKTIMSKTTTITVPADPVPEKLPTTLTGKSKVTFKKSKRSKTKSFKFKLTSNGAKVSGVKVLLKLDKKSLKSIKISKKIKSKKAKKKVKNMIKQLKKGTYSVVTKKGVAKLSLSAKYFQFKKLKKGKLTASFKGDDKYLPSDKTTVLVMK